jgi:hypothetical protein
MLLVPLLTSHYIQNALILSPVLQLLWIQVPPSPSMPPLYATHYDPSLSKILGDQAILDGFAARSPPWFKAPAGCGSGAVEATYTQGVVCKVCDNVEVSCRGGAPGSVKRVTTLSVPSFPNNPEA